MGIQVNNLGAAEATPPPREFLHNIAYKKVHKEALTCFELLAYWFATIFSCCYSAYDRFYTIELAAKENQEIPSEAFTPTIREESTVTSRESQVPKQDDESSEIEAFNNACKGVVVSSLLRYLPGKNRPAATPIEPEVPLAPLIQQAAEEVLPRPNAVEKQREAEMPATQETPKLFPEEPVRLVAARHLKLLEKEQRAKSVAAQAMLIQEAVEPVLPPANPIEEKRESLAAAPAMVEPRLGPPVSAIDCKLQRMPSGERIQPKTPSPKAVEPIVAPTEPTITPSQNAEALVLAVPPSQLTAVDPIKAPTEPKIIKFIRGGELHDFTGRAGLRKNKTAFENDGEVLTLDSLRIILDGSPPLDRASYVSFYENGKITVKYSDKNPSEIAIEISNSLDGPDETCIIDPTKKYKRFQTRVDCSETLILENEMVYVTDRTDLSNPGYLTLENPENPQVAKEKELEELFKSSVKTQKLFDVEGHKVGVIFAPEGNAIQLLNDISIPSNVGLISDQKIPETVSDAIIEKIPAGNTFAMMGGGTVNGLSMLRSLGFE